MYIGLACLHDARAVEPERVCRFDVALFCWSCCSRQDVLFHGELTVPLVWPFGTGLLQSQHLSRTNLALMHKPHGPLFLGRTTYTRQGMHEAILQTDGCQCNNFAFCGTPNEE